MVQWLELRGSTPVRGTSFPPRPLPDSATSCPRLGLGAHPVLASLHAAENCRNPLTPDRAFVLDRVPGTERTFCASGAAPAFKIPFVLGRLLVDLGIEGVPEPGYVHAMAAPSSTKRDLLSTRHPDREESCPTSYVLTILERA